MNIAKHEQLLAFETEIVTKLVPQLINKPIKILDFGCGKGLMTHFIANAFFNAQVYGVDINQSKIEQAKTNFPTIIFKAIEVDTPLFFADNFFDVIYCSQVLHHIQQEKHSEIIKEFMRILKQNGYLIIFELNPINPFTAYRFYKDQDEKKSAMIWPWKLRKLLKIYGKCNLRFYYLFFEKHRWLQWMEPVLARLPFGELYVVKIISN